MSIPSSTGLESYGAIEHPDADFEVMSQVRRVLVDDGRVVITFPFNESKVIVPGFERWYTPGRLKRLFDGWFVVDCEYWVPDLGCLADGSDIDLAQSQKLHVLIADSGEKLLLALP